MIKSPLNSIRELIGRSRIYVYWAYTDGFENQAEAIIRGNNNNPYSSHLVNDLDLDLEFDLRLYPGESIGYRSKSKQREESKGQE